MTDSGETRQGTKSDKESGSVKMDDSVHKAHDIAEAVKQLKKIDEQYERRLYKEIDAHIATRERGASLQDDIGRVKADIENERQAHVVSQTRTQEIDRFHMKSDAALRAMRDDLMAVRLQNEALQAEMEVQRKAFMVNVNWATLYTEVKGKHDGLVQDTEQLKEQYAQMQKALNTATNGQEECKAARVQVLEALERAKEDLEKSNELLRCAKLTEEVAAQLGESGDLKAILQANGAKRKKQREKARSAMEKSLMANSSMIVGTVFNAWERHYKDAKLNKSKKEQSKAMAMRGIANSSLAVQDFCLTAWHKLMQEVQRQKLEEANRVLQEKHGASGQAAEASRRKALAQLEKQFGDGDKALTREFYAAWQNLRHDRMKKEKAKSIAARSIAGAGSALLQQVCAGWVTVFTEAKAKSAKKASGQGRAMRMIADGDNAMLDFCLTQWAQLTQKAVATNKAKEDSNTKALRLIAGSQQMMVQQCYANWAGLKKKSNDREAKMKAVERGLVQGGAAFQQYIMQNWRTLIEKKKKSNAKKAVSMKQGLKKIASSECALQADILGIWCKEARAGKQARIDADIEAKRNAPAEADPEQLRNEIEAQELKAKMADLRAQCEEQEAKMQEIEDMKTEANKASLALDEKIRGAKEELSESRRRAKEINEELTKVGQFLMNKPRKPPSRPTSGKGDADPGKLPRLDQKAPNTAREYRPDSGGSRGKAELVAPARPPSKEAWSEGL